MELNKKGVKRFPKYVSLSEGCAMRRTKVVGKVATYYRENGDWDISAIMQSGVVIAIGEYSQVGHLTGTELIPITQEEWEKDDGI